MGSSRGASPVAGLERRLPGGIVAYDNGIKEQLLGVPAELLAEHGAVSAEVAAAMANGARSGSASTWPCR